MPGYKKFKKYYKKMKTKKASKLETKKEIKQDLKTLAMHMRKGERSMSYKGNVLPPVLHTKFTYVDACINNFGNDNYRVNDLYNFEIFGSTPTIYPSYYHTFFPLNGSLYNNFAVYAVDITLDVWSQNTSTSTDPMIIVWFDVCEQNNNGITNIDQAMSMPGAKTYTFGSTNAGYENKLRIRRKFNMCDYMANAFDISYTGLVAASPTNGLYTQLQYYDAITGALIASTAKVCTTSLKVIFDVSCYGLKYNNIT